MDEHENPYKLSVLFHTTGFSYHIMHTFSSDGRRRRHRRRPFLVTSRHVATQQDISQRFCGFSLPRAMFDFGSEQRVSRIRTSLTIKFILVNIHIQHSHSRRNAPHESLRLEKCTNNVPCIWFGLSRFRSRAIGKVSRKKKTTNKHTKINWHGTRRHM